MKNKYKYFIRHKGKAPSEERKKYNKTPPEVHIYEGTVYYFKRKIHDNMYLYENKLGIRICFDNFELCIKE